MTTRPTRFRFPLVTVGEIILVCYLVTVVAIAILQHVTGQPTIAEMASSPTLLVQGQWWRLATSGFIIQGPAIPQIVAIAVLGGSGIYFGGSWLFWRTAILGHVVGTMVAYGVFSVIWLANHAAANRFLTNPDYGVSLIWCAALGAFASWSWLGSKGDLRRPVHPVPAILTGVLMAIVVTYSDPMAAVQHVVAYLVGLGIIATADRSRILHRQRRLPGRAMRRA